MAQEAEAPIQDVWQFSDMDWRVVCLVCKIDKETVSTGGGGRAPKVFVAGEFCGWEQTDWLSMHCSVHYSRDQREQMITDDDGDGNKTETAVQEVCHGACTEYRIHLRLLEGAYQYKFIVNGQWVCDSNTPHRSQQYGNSVLFVDCDPNLPSPHSGVVLRKHWTEPHRQHRSNDDCFRTEYPQVSDECAQLGTLQRPVFVYLPSDYHVSCDQTLYPVLYVLDGQDAFSTPAAPGDNMGGGWWLDSQLDLLCADNGTRPFIIVAIPNGNFVAQYPLRKREYCPRSFDDVINTPFSKYLTQSVIPLIDGKYRTIASAEHRVLLGFSMAGLYSFAMLWKAPHIIGHAVSMSPSFWFHEQSGLCLYDIVDRDCKRVAGGSIYASRTTSPSDDGTASEGCCGSDRRQIHDSGSAPETEPIQSTPCLADVVAASAQCTDKDDLLYVYLDSGDGEGDNQYEAACMNDVLASSGVLCRDKHYAYKLETRASQVPFGVTHCQAVVRNRVHHALRLFFPPIAS